MVYAKDPVSKNFPYPIQENEDQKKNQSKPAGQAMTPLITTNFTRICIISKSQIIVRV
jgi:hypothetical protein